MLPHYVSREETFMDQIKHQVSEYDLPPLTRRERHTVFSPLRLVIVLVLCVFSVEFLVMVLLHNMKGLSPVAEFLLDALLLSLALCPAFVFLLLRPLKRLVYRYQASEKQLRLHKEHLEQEVKARTAALDDVVQQLRNEIIERDKVKNDLDKNADMLEVIIESIGSPLFFKDGEGRYLGCNKAFSTYLGCTKEQIIGSTVFDIASEDLAAIYHQADLDLMKSGGTQTYEAQVRYADGDLHDIVFNKSVILHRDGQTGGLVGVMLDMTKLKQAEDEKDRLAQSLLHSQKIESIGRLAAGVAHDFNNLLTPILGYAEMLRQASSDDRTAKRVNGIIDAATKARELNRQLLAFGRKQLLEMKLVDPNQIIEAFNSILSRTIRGDISITLKLDPEAGTVLADKGQLEQILMNLAINAQDAMPNGGQLIIETANLMLSQSPVGNFNLKPGPYVLLMVSDNGCGMDSETINHIFEPFYTTKEVGHGTGLGLATVFGIVSQHDGSINVYSETGYGTTFKLYFPRQDESPSAEIPVEESEYLTDPNGSTILLVEDNSMVREMTQELLEESGYTVFAADGSEQAIPLLKNLGRTVDLLLSDVIMPGLNGPTLFEVLKEHQPDLKVLFMSGYSENIISLQGIGDDSPHYIRKPFTPNILLKKITKLITPDAE